MNYYEWEIEYLKKLIKRKEVNLRNVNKTNYMALYRNQRELEALETVLQIVQEESEHLNKMLK